MANFTTEHLRNIVLIGHGGSGKTTLAEAMLFDTGVLSRRGRVEDGTTVADWDEEAIRRKQSVAASVVACEHKGNKLNLLDTPGFLDFVGEAKGAVSVADAGLVLVDPVSGVEVGTELGWGYLDERQLPRAVFVNKMDRENAQFERVLANLRERLQRHDCAGLPADRRRVRVQGRGRRDRAEGLHGRGRHGRRDSGRHERRGGSGTHANGGGRGRGRRRADHEVPRRRGVDRRGDRARPAGRHRQRRHRAGVLRLGRQ